RACLPIARNLAIVSVTAMMMLFGPITVLRAYQTSHLRRIFTEQYLGAKREPLRIVESSIVGNSVAISMPAFWESRKMQERVNTEYLVLEFSPRTCKALFVPLSFRYDATGPSGDLSH